MKIENIPGMIERVLEEGRERASLVARQTLAEVKERVGLT